MATFWWIVYLIVSIVAWGFHVPWVIVAMGAAVVAYFAVLSALSWRRARAEKQLLIERVKHYPGDLQARRQLLWRMIESKDFALAAPLAEELVAKGSDDGESLHLLGLARLRVSDFAGARSALGASCALDRDRFDGQTLRLLAEAQEGDGQLAEAEASLLAACKRSQSDVVARVALARFYARRSRTNDARAYFTDATAVYRDLPAYLRSKSRYAAAQAWLWRLLN